MQHRTVLTREPTASERVVEAVATLEGVDPLDLDVPLFESVDPDALDQLVRNGDGAEERSSVRVEFTYEGYDVTVGAGGSVDVTERL